MKWSWPVWLLVWLATALGGCRSAPAGDIVLQAGHFTLTEDALQALRAQGGYRELSDAQLAERLVTEARIMAFALQHRFDTLSLLQRQLAYAMRYQVSSVNGYLWNRKVKPLLQVPVDELKKAYALRTHEYWLEFAFFPDERSLQNVYRASTDSIGGLLTALRKHAGVASAGQTFSGWRTFPFVPLAVYLPALATPEVGRAYGPVRTLHGYCVVHVKDKRPAAARSFAQDSAAIESELLLALQEEQIWKSQEEVMQSTRPVFHDTAIDAVAALAMPSGDAWRGVAPGKVLMEYTWQGQRRAFTMVDLQELMQCQPIVMGELQQTGTLKKLMESHLIGIYLYEQAKGMDMEADPLFQLQQQQLLRGLYIQHYKQSQVYPRLSVSEQQIVDAWHLQSQSLRGFGKARMVRYAFADMPSALAARQALLDRGVIDRSLPARRVPGKGDTVSIAGTDTLYGHALVETVNRLQPGNLSMPVQDGDHFFVCRLLHKEGNMPLPLKYARRIIHQQLLAAQERSLLEALVSLYPISNNRLGDFLAIGVR